MYEESAGFDQGINLHGEDGGNKNQSNYSMDESSFNPQIPISQQEIELQQQLHLEMEQCYSNNNGGEIQEIVHDSNWHEMGSFNNAENNHNHNHNYNHHHHQNNHPSQDYNIQNGTILDQIPYPTTPDLSNMFPLPKYSPNITFSSSVPHKSSPSFLASLGILGDLNPPAAADGGGAAVYDPLLPLNLPPQPPLLRELFHSLPHGGYTLGSRNGSLFDERENLYQNGGGSSYDNGVFEFTAGEMDCVAKNREGKDTKHFATERHRRVLLNDKYQALRKLVPSPTKNDRASVVGDAINYINELKRTVAELKVLVEKKRCAKERMKRPKTENDESKSLVDHMDNPFNDSPMRSSWLHRKSKNTEVDVRIIDDEVTVKLVQQKRINCLLFVSKVLDELQLDLHHVAGGLIGDYYSFLFNSKICEGSIVYASAVANKLIEVVDKQYAAIPPTNSY